MAAVQTLDAVRRETSHRWDAHPRIAAAIRFAVWLAPLLASIGTTWLVSRNLPAADDAWSSIRQWVVIIAVSMASYWIAARCARRFLPLAAMLRLALLFPDQAPSRFSIALRAGNAKSALSQNASSTTATPAEAAAEILGLVARLNRHDRLTRGHSERVRAYCDLLADELGLDKDDAARLRWSGLLHDVGKLDVPAEILNKPSSLDADEWIVLKQHPITGAHRARALGEWMGPWFGAVRHHHERFDGRGYPDGLAANEIPYAGRIVAVADAFDVMTSARSYKRPMSVEKALEELVRCSGSQFDPQVVRAFLNIRLGTLKSRAGFLSSIVHLVRLNPASISPMITSGVGPAAAAASLSVGAFVAGVMSLPELSRYLPPSTESADRPEQTATTADRPVTSISGGANREPQAPASTQVGGTTGATPSSLPAADPASPIQPASEPGLAAPSATTSTRPAPAPNELPTITADALEVTQGQSASLFPLANDTDPDGDRLTVESLVQPARGSASVDASGRVTYQAPVGFVGADSFAYRVSDGVNAVQTGQIAVTVLGVNHPPTAVNDSWTTSGSTSAMITVVGNDTDSDGEPLTVTNVAAPLFGTATAVGGGKVSYTPAAGFVGIDTFTYTVGDPGGLTSSATVQVTVFPAPGAPRLMAAPGPDLSSPTPPPVVASGTLYVFVANSANVTSVRWYVDDPARNAGPFATVSSSPFDTTPGPAVNGFATGSLPNGKHSLTAVLTMSDGSTRLLNHMLTTNN